MLVCMSLVGEDNFINSRNCIPCWIRAIISFKSYLHSVPKKSLLFNSFAP